MKKKNSENITKTQQSKQKVEIIFCILVLFSFICETKQRTGNRKKGNCMIWSIGRGKTKNSKELGKVFSERRKDKKMLRNAIDKDSDFCHGEINETKLSDH